MKKRRDPEAQLQAAVVRLFERRQVRGAIAFHVPNEGKRSFAEHMDQLEGGLLPGVSDLVFISAAGQAFLMELKTKKGRLSEAQLEFQARVLNTKAGYAVIRSLTDAEAQLVEWRLIKLEESL